MNQSRLWFLIVSIFLSCMSSSAYAQENLPDRGSVQSRITVQNGANDPGNDMVIQAHILSRQGKNMEAEQLFKAALAYWKRTSPTSPRNYPSCLNNLGLLYAHQGNYAQAAPCYEEALTLEEKSLSVNDPLHAITLDNLAQVYRSQGRLQEAEPLYLKALNIEEKNMAPDDQDHAITMYNLSLLYFQLKEYDKCEPLMVKSLAVLKNSLGPNNPDYLNVYKYYLVLLRKTNRSAQADTLEQQVYGYKTNIH